MLFYSSMIFSSLSRLFLQVIVLTGEPTSKLSIANGALHPSYINS